MDTDAATGDRTPARLCQIRNTRVLYFTSRYLSANVLTGDKWWWGLGGMLEN